MNHPFGQVEILKPSQQQQVSGASIDLRGLIEEKPGKRSPIERPPIGTTLAIGEEGGGTPEADLW